MVSEPSEADLAKRQAEDSQLWAKQDPGRISGESENSALFGPIGGKLGQPGEA
jgi:hypothetical protein